MFNQAKISQKRSFSYLTIHIVMWEYLQSLGAPEDNPLWLGTTLSAITITDILSGLVIETVLDSSHNNHPLVLLLDCPQILGSLLPLLCVPLHAPHQQACVWPVEGDHNCVSIRHLLQHRY